MARATRRSSLQSTVHFIVLSSMQDSANMTPTVFSAYFFPASFCRSASPAFWADAVDVVTQLQDDMEELLIDGIDLDESQGRITIHQLQDQPGVAAEIFGEIGKQGIVVDMIVQSHLESGAGAISFTQWSVDTNKPHGISFKIFC